jgi:hypothetical protein
MALNGCIFCRRTSASALSMAWARTGPSPTKTCFHFSLRSSARSEYPASPETLPFLRADPTRFQRYLWGPSEGGERWAWSAWAGIGGPAATPSRPRSSVSSTHVSGEAPASQAARKEPNQQRIDRTGHWRRRPAPGSSLRRASRRSKQMPPASSPDLSTSTPTGANGGSAPRSSSSAPTASGPPAFC